MPLHHTRLYVCPHTTYMCPHTAYTCLSSYHKRQGNRSHLRCPHTTVAYYCIYVVILPTYMSSYYVYMCPHTTYICVHILRPLYSYSYYFFLFPHTTPARNFHDELKKKVPKGLGKNMEQIFTQLRLLSEARFPNSGNRVVASLFISKFVVPNMLAPHKHG